MRLDDSKLRVLDPLSFQSLIYEANSIPGQFTVSGATLSLLKAGEWGVVTRVTSTDRMMVQKLVTMGVVPGTIVTLEQRSPHYRIKVDEHQFVIGHETAQAIYVRLTEASPSPQFWPLPGLAQITPSWLKCFALKSIHSTSRQEVPSQSVVP